MTCSKPTRGVVDYRSMDRENSAQKGILEGGVSMPKDKGVWHSKPIGYF